MSICLHDTMAGRKVSLAVAPEETLRMYVCGVTVYDVCHLGHARMMVAFDVIARYLAWSGRNLKFVRNFTDVDDKIIKRANELGVPAQQVSEQNIELFYRDMRALGVFDSQQGAPEGMIVEEPRVSTTMEGILEMVSKLIERGHAYEVDGDVYFAVRSFNGYGKLSRRDLDEMSAGARIAVDERKRDPMDFALWKSAKAGEPEWGSPWGPGRPGWHIECSAMNHAAFGDTTDIHGGGKDLIFPHHENEIAQTEGATGVRPWVKHWLHNGFVNVDDEKMSKSLQNFFAIEDVLKFYDAETLRFFLLTTHWRSPINYSTVTLDEALRRLTYFQETLARVDDALRGVDVGEVKANHELLNAFTHAMDDDFNTAAVLGALSGPFKEANDRLAGAGASGPERHMALASFRAAIDSIAKPLGVLNTDPAKWLAARKAEGAAQSALAPEDIEAMIAQRTQARADKDWAKADELRDALASKGIILRDGPEGTTWTVE